MSGKLYTQLSSFYHTNIKVMIFTVYLKLVKKKKYILGQSHHAVYVVHLWLSIHFSQKPFCDTLQKYFLPSKMAVITFLSTLGFEFSLRMSSVLEIKLLLSGSTVMNIFMDFLSCSLPRVA